MYFPYTWANPASPAFTFIRKANSGMTSVYWAMISGRSGLGPMKDISPRRILISWGSSSRRHLRITFPIGVMRSSFFCARRATPSFSASVRMLRNFMI